MRQLNVQQKSMRIPHPRVDTRGLVSWMLSRLCWLGLCGSGGNTDTQLRGKCLHTAQLHLTNWNASAKSHWRCPRVSQMYLWDCQKLHRIYSGLVTFWSRSCSCLGYLKWHRSFMCGQLNQAVCVNLELDCDWKAKKKFSSAAEETKKLVLQAPELQCSTCNLISIIH